MADDLRARKKCSGNSSGMENGKPGWWPVRQRRPHPFLFRSRQADQPGRKETQRSHLVHREFPVLLVYGKPCVDMLIDETRTIQHQCVGDAGSMP